MDFLYEAIAEDFERLEEVLADAFRVEGDLMGEVADYVAAGRGKRLRPAVVCLAARACGYDPAGDHHILLGAAVELFHVATLLHDDVIDRAPLRRGRQTVNARWGDDVAILFADYLYATSFDLALSTLEPATVRMLSRATQQMTQGEFLQVERRGQWLSEADYMEIITKKTAVLFSAAASLGALVGGAPAQTVLRFGQYGLDFGLAFQITDDTLDYEAQTDRWGKRVGSDLAEGKQTLPLLRTLAVATEEDRATLVRVLENGRDFATVHSYVARYGGIGHSLDRAGDHCRSALGALDDVGLVNEPMNLLRQIADRVLVRTH
ncbi:MAG: polyprenyl synthetase family protein [Candidatus Sumerlaeia bacterium]|nr:polyprenyl synthetase family protein [Candidatus Sumerlaeia bacterium]